MLKKLIMLILLLSAISIISFADLELTTEEKQWLEEHKVLYHAPDPDYPPFEFKDEDGIYKGIFIDYLRLIEKDLGIEIVSLDLESWTEALDAVRTREADFIAGATPSDERAVYMNFTEPYFKVKTVVIARSENREVATVEDLSGKLVATISDWTMNDYLLENHPGIIPVAYDSIDDAIKATSFGEVDAVILGIATASYSIEKNKFTNLKIIGELDYTYDLAFAVRKDYSELIGVLEKALDNIPKEEKIEIEKKWISINNTSLFGNKVFWQYLIGVAIIALLAFVWGVSLRYQVGKRTREIEAINKRLKDSRAELRKIIDSIPHMVFVTNYKGEFVLANEATAKEFDEELEIMMGNKLINFVKGHQKEKVEEFLALDRKVIENKENVVLHDVEIINMENTKGIYHLMKIPIKIEVTGEICALTTAMNITSEVNAKTELALKVEELNDLNRTLEDSLDTLRETQRQLIESEKLAALGGLVAGISHEVSTPIGLGITTISHMEVIHKDIVARYNEKVMKKSDLYKYFLQVEEDIGIMTFNLERAVELISNFKVMSVNQLSNEKTIFNVCECLDSVIISLKHESKRKGHKFNVACVGPMMVSSYPGAFSQIFTNFIMNSLIHGFEFIKEGEIDIKIIKQDDGLHIQYRDNGCGMTEENLERIFEPFFTTKKGRGGSGLGMQIVYSIVTQNLSGKIKCESEKGEGVLFDIRIPLVDNETSEKD